MQQLVQVVPLWGKQATGISTHPVAIAVKVVVKGELGVCRNVLLGEETDGQLPAHQPLLCLTIGRAAVVDEAPQAALLRRSLQHAGSVASTLICRQITYCTGPCLVLLHLQSDSGHPAQVLTRAGRQAARHSMLLPCVALGRMLHKRTSTLLTQLHFCRDRSCCLLTAFGPTVSHVLRL